MELSQNKLSKSEWESIEKLVDKNEKKILDMICAGYHDVNIRINESLSLNSYIRFAQTNEMDYFLFKKYFEEVMNKSIKEYGDDVMNNYSCSLNKTGKLRKIKSGESIKLGNLENNIKLNKHSIFEYILIDLFTDLLKQIKNKKKKYAYYLYTLIQLKKSAIPYINVYVIDLLDYTIDHVNSFTYASEIIANAYQFIEKNKYLLKYEDRKLFNHQKELFTLCNRKNEEVLVPKLIVYTAPTGTGKTLSPLGLAMDGTRIIFVCVARHIGLALAKSAISVEKKVAFAFGCETADDIRLHYFAATDYIVNKRSGGIGKVDNSVGDKVEIMICDVQSYLTAMHYMLAFNEKENIITYWDEPTITLDYEEHDLHSVIHSNWKNNMIPRIVLSCATMPNEEAMQPVYADFMSNFENADIHRISSFDCRKSIPILDSLCYCVLPHYLDGSYERVVKSTIYCKENKTILRYLDLREIINYIEYVNEKEYIDDSYNIDNYFGGNITDITMNSLKEYYLESILHTKSEYWNDIYMHMIKNRKPRFNENQTNNQIRKIKSVNSVNSKEMEGNVLSRTVSLAAGMEKRVEARPNRILITTEDAYTLTDGPTIFLTNNVDKIARFYIQSTKIPENIFAKILDNIKHNNNLTEKIEKIERAIETQEENDGRGDTKGKETKYKMSNEVRKLTIEKEKLEKNVKIVSLDAEYLPNTCSHQKKWSPDGEIRENGFISNIGEEMSKEIMLLNIEDHLKFLLLLGIGVFKKIDNKRYLEIIKQLADEQRLYMIIASTDYIYGTNYQFCHGFISKDLTNMTQQKTLQAMGRVGRNNIQQDYTIRFRDNEMIRNLFKEPEHNMEAINMQRLFVS